MRYEVLSGDAIIGWSELECGDPPMGVAFGRFHPSNLYVPSRHSGPNCGLRVRPEGGDEFIEPSEYVFIEDRSTEFGLEGIEVSILGLGAATYERFFLDHVKRYEAQFRQ